jgi:NCS1 family nucleobase:cation symporter-1
LFPEYFKICRGILFAVLIDSLAMVPSIILPTAPDFLKFLSVYAVFMAPIADTMLTNY